MKGLTVIAILVALAATAAAKPVPAKNHNAQWSCGSDA